MKDISFGNELNKETGFYQFCREAIFLKSNDFDKTVN